MKKKLQLSLLITAFLINSQAQYQEYFLVQKLLSLSLLLLKDNNGNFFIQIVDTISLAIQTFKNKQLIRNTVLATIYSQNFI